MTRTHARSGIFATGLAALLSAALIAAIPGYAAESVAETPTTASQQNAAKELAKNLSEAYSRVRTVQNGDVVTLIDPNHSPDVGTSTRSRRRMAPRISIPSQYQAPVTSIRSQGGYPICWAFGATSAVEANVLRKTQGTAQPNGNSAGSATILPYGGISPNVSSTQPDYSEANLVYSVFNTYAGKNDAFSLNYGGVGNSYKKYHGYNNGGNWGETAATLAGWYGETDEALNPYQTEFSAANADAMYQRGVSTAGQSQLHVSDIEELPAPYGIDSSWHRIPDASKRSTIKQAIYNEGALAASFYIQAGGQGQVSSNVRNAYVVTSGNGIATVNATNDQSRHTNQFAIHASSFGNTSNHMVTLAGWDDTYSRFNFMVPLLNDNGNEREYDATVAEVVKVTYTTDVDNTVTKDYIVPKEDGAWLLKNQWGTYMGDQGFHWLSYMDTTLDSIVRYRTEDADVSTKPGNTVHEYDTIDQYDAATASSYSSNSDPMPEANIFTASHAQHIKAIGLWTMEDNTEATIDVYVDGDGKTPTSGTKVVDGQVADITYTGYHTVKLDKPVELAKGQRYAVVVTLKQISGKSADNGAPYYYLVEGGSVSNYNVTSNEGESYVYYYGSWVDSTLLRTYLGSNFTSGNVLVKAIGTQDIDVESVDLSGRGAGSHLSMQLGSVFPVDAAIEPANATDKTLTWRSSDPTVASVDSEGNVKALRAGNATITARAASGAEGRLDITVVYIPVQKVTIGRDDAGGAGAGESAGSAGSGGVAGSGGADSLRLGDSVILHATVTPTNATYLDGIVWGSTNPKVVKVDQSGIVTTVGRGSATVTAIAGHVGALYRVSVE